MMTASVLATAKLVATIHWRWHWTECIVKEELETPQKPCLYDYEVTFVSNRPLTPIAESALNIQSMMEMGP